MANPGGMRGWDLNAIPAVAGHVRGRPSAGRLRAIKYTCAVADPYFGRLFAARCWPKILALAWIRLA